MLAKHDDNLAWIDLEMTGLDPEKDRILEIATIVTSPDLNEVAEGPTFIIKQDDALLDSMGEWVKNQHEKSGLTEAVRNSTVSENEAVTATLEFFLKYLNPGKSPMCGNTVSHDRKFLERYMPELANFFHYRHVDVSTIKELARRWKPEVVKMQPQKDTTHRALDDIRESIAELKYYRSHFIRL